MAAQPGFFRYVTAAFNARPWGMFVAPNWVGLAAMGLLGIANPGFWVLGAGLELGYLLLLSTNSRFQRTVVASGLAKGVPTHGDDWTARLGKALLSLNEQDRRRYQRVADRCRSIIDLQTRHSASGLVGFEAQQESLARLTWMYLRLMLTRQAIERVHSETAGEDLAATLARLERRLEDEQPVDDLRRSVEGQIEILRQRIAHRKQATSQMTYIDSELTRIEQQVELIREQAALSTDPGVLSRRIDEITATLGGTSQWIRDQQQVFGAIEDLMVEAPPIPDAQPRLRQLH
jgi:hypothetical protein